MKRVRWRVITEQEFNGMLKLYTKKLNLKCSTLGEYEPPIEIYFEDTGKSDLYDEQWILSYVPEIDEYRFNLCSMPLWKCYDKEIRIKLAEHEIYKSESIISNGLGQTYQIMEHELGNIDYWKMIITSSRYDSIGIS